MSLRDVFLTLDSRMRGNNVIEGRHVQPDLLDSRVRGNDDESGGVVCQEGDEPTSLIQPGLYICDDGLCGLQRVG